MFWKNSSVSVVTDNMSHNLNHIVSGLLLAWISEGTVILNTLVKEERELVQ